MPISTLWVIFLLNRQNVTGAEEHLQMAKQQINKKQV